MRTRPVLVGAVGCLVAAGLAWGEANPVEDTLPPPPAGKTWKMVWHDEFDGVALDETKWETPPDGPRKTGWWMRKAVSLDGRGHLVIQTSREGDKIIGGCVRTKDRFEHTFGYYVARIRLQKEQGHWSAFWLYGPGVQTVGSDGRNGTEIDIYEKFWPNDEVQHTLYWDSNGRDEKSRLHTATVPGIREGWHTFAVWWKFDAYVFYVDSRETWRINPGAICQVPEYIKLSDETNTWCKDITKAKLPDEFLVDYVRVYDVTDK
jgi:beta-glucanase (GH16 family)